MSSRTSSIRAAVIGASGYTGAELVRLLHGHPLVTIEQLIAQKNANHAMGDIYPHLEGYDLPTLISFDDANWDSTDLVFCCLPHATSQAIIKELPEHLKVIDLSADFRIEDANTYEQWYHTPHLAPELQKEAAYGLSEVYRSQIRNARLIACPGCYPTSVTLPLIPLLKNNVIKTDSIIIDAKSGITGAGRSLKQHLLFTEANDNFKAYNVAQHRHIPEIEQTLSNITTTDISIEFTPHLVPMNRGILSTIYVQLSDGLSYEDARHALENSYKDETFVHICKQGTLPATRDVAGTNQCRIAIEPGRNKGSLILVSVIDNLIKGASGQAVQNMNMMYDIDESTGLTQTPLFP